MNKGKVLYEGKAKIVYETDDPGALLVYFKDDATAGNGAKKGTIVDKGVMNNKISTYFFELLKSKGVDNHFIESVSPREMLVKKLDMVLLEVIVRNVAAGSLAKRLGVEEGKPLPLTVVEYCYKNDELGDPMFNRYHILALDLATTAELDEIERISLLTNDIMKEKLHAKNVELIDFKLEFGRDKDGKLLLADEISPDNCRFWDTVTKEKLDKDRFRRDLGGVEDAYKEILDRLTK